MLKLLSGLKTLIILERGIGKSAIKILTHKLFKNKFNTLIIRPCTKNIRAIRSYSKAGFIEASFKAMNSTNQIKGMVGTDMVLTNSAVSSGHVISLKKTKNGNTVLIWWKSTDQIY